MTKQLIIEPGTQVGMLYKEFFTKRGEKKVRFRGYIFLGIFGGEGIGLEIMVYKIDDFNKPSWVAEDKDFYRIKSGRKYIGWLLKEEKRSKKTGKLYHYLKGKIYFDSIDLRIKAYPAFKNTFSINSENSDNQKPDYILESDSIIECAILKLA